MEEWTTQVSLPLGALPHNLEWPLSEMIPASTVEPTTFHLPCFNSLTLRSDLSYYFIIDSALLKFWLLTPEHMSCILGVNFLPLWSIALKPFVPGGCSENTPSLGHLHWDLGTHLFVSVQFSSVQLLNHVWLFATPWITARQASLSITNSWRLLKLMSIERWCHPAISSSVVPFSSCPQSLPASESFPMSQLFAWGGQSIGVSASAPVLPMNTQDRSALVWTGWISLQSKGLSRVFSNTTVEKHQFFGTQLSSQSNSHIHTWPLEKP